MKNIKSLKRQRSGRFYKMKLIIDARMVTENLHGIGRYTYELICGLNKKEDVIITLITNNIEESKKIFACLDNIKFIQMKSGFLSPMEVIELPLVLNKHKDCIFHSTSFSASPFIRIESYITIHDLNHLALPQYYSKIKQYYYKFVVKPFAKKCKKIFTVSEFSKKEIIKWLNCDENKVIVTYNGIDEKFKKTDDKTILKNIQVKYSLPEKFVLYIGNLKEHKNVETLIKSMNKVYGNYKLIINGKANERIDKVIKEYMLKDRVQFIGYVDEDDLPCIYSLASVFVFPSLYEGFGLPPLEAMACGCPTIVANTSSLPEVVGDAAIKVESLDYDNIAYYINKLIEEDGKVNQIINSGDINVKRFRWDKMVDETYVEIKK